MIDYLKEWVDLSPYIGSPALEGVRFNPKKIGRDKFLGWHPLGWSLPPFMPMGFICKGMGMEIIPTIARECIIFKSPAP